MPPHHDPAPSSAVIAAYAQLLSLAVHELRTPASVVGGYLRMLRHDTTSPLDARQAKMVEEAEKSYARLVSLITELSEISKLDAGTAAIQRESFDLFGLIQEVTQAHASGSEAVKLEVRGEREGAPIVGDRTRLRIAFAACLRAVVREQTGPCAIAVDRQRRVSGSGTSAVIVIAREADVARAYSAPPIEFDEQRGGLGLALPIAARVISQHGGRIWSATPAEPGNSRSARSTIVISLPIGVPD